MPSTPGRSTLQRLAGAMAVVLAAVVAAGGTASAQETTRAQEIAAEQAKKAAEAKPYTPNKFERIMDAVEAGLASPPSGVYPVLDSVYGGGGLTLGAGYRRFFARRAVWDVEGLYSIKNYKLVRFDARTPSTDDGRLNLGFQAGWRDATQVGYYGLGIDTSKDDRANADIQETWARGDVEYRPAQYVRLDGSVAYEDYRTGHGSGGDPSIETVYDPATAPGLGADPDYVHSEATAAIDWRPSAGYARRGGYYAVTLADYRDVDDVYSFQRFHANVVQHIPLLYNNWVVSLRGRLQSTLDDDDQVPYFLMPSLGSGSTLRGYKTGRFRDRHAVLTSAELRWLPNKFGLDMALFYDAGTVAARRADLRLDEMKTDWGIGARFHAFTSTFLRIEWATGSDGQKIVFASSAAF
jgi:outer membrane protein assembly factor BamA